MALSHKNRREIICDKMSVKTVWTPQPTSRAKSDVMMEDIVVSVYRSGYVDALVELLDNAEVRSMMPTELASVLAREIAAIQVFHQHEGDER